MVHWLFCTTFLSTILILFMGHNFSHLLTLCTYLHPHAVCQNNSLSYVQNTIFAQRNQPCDIICQFPPGLVSLISKLNRLANLLLRSLYELLVLLQRTLQHFFITYTVRHFQMQTTYYFCPVLL